MHLQQTLGRKTSFLSGTAVICCLLSVMPLPAQTDGASITGTVLDQVGATIPNVRVMLVNLETFETMTLNVRRVEGKFAFNNLHNGRYALIAAGEATSNCWEPAMRQVVIQNFKPVDVKLKMSLDKRMPKCLEPVT